MSGGTLNVDGVINVGGSIVPEDYDIAAPSIYVDSCVNALVFTDRTPWYSSGDALKELQKIKGKNGKIDHASLPDFARMIQKHQDKKKGTVIDTTRDLGATITMLTVAIQQLSAQVDSLKAAQGGAPHGMNGNGGGLYGLIGAAALAAGVGAAALKKKKEKYV
jgi:hypothetical protein